MCHPTCSALADRLERRRPFESVRPPPEREQRAARTTDEAPEYQRHVSKAADRKAEHRDHLAPVREPIDHGESRIGEIACEQRAREHAERSEDEVDAEQRDDRGDRGLPIEPRNQRRDRDRDRRDHQADDDAEAADARDLLLRQLAMAQDRRGEPELVDQRDEAEIHGGHAHQPVVGRGEDARDYEGGRPAEDLGRPLRSPRPRDARHERAVELLAVGLRRGEGYGVVGDRQLGSGSSTRKAARSM